MSEKRVIAGKSRIGHFNSIQGPKTELKNKNGWIMKQCGSII